MPLPKTIIKQQFPAVTKIIDARRSLTVSVKPIDASSGRKKDPEQCALARACVREKIADAAIIGLGYSYLIRGNHAIRYQTSPGVAREIVSFDRHQDFATGTDYKLLKVSPAHRIGIKRKLYNNRENSHKSVRKVIPQRHYTSGVRVYQKTSSSK